MAYRFGIVFLISLSIFVYFTQPAQNPDYYDIIAAGTVFYIVLMSFMLERIVNRIEQERNLILDLFYSIKQARHLADQIRSKTLYALEAMLYATSLRDLNAAYITIVDLERSQPSGLGSDIMPKLARFSASRSSGIGFGDFFSLAGMTFLIIYAAIVFRPTSMFGDMFGIITSFSIFFLFLRLFDLLHSRKQLSLKMLDGDTQPHLVASISMRFREEEDRYWSIGLILFVLAGFITLFYMKHS